MWQVWDCVGGHGRSPDNIERFAGPAVRRRMVELIREARRLDEQAIESIESALAMAP